MNLKSLIDPQEAEGHPGEVFAISFVYTILAIAVSIFISSSYASLLMILFAVVALVPMFYNVMALEAAKAEKIKRELPLLKQHAKAVNFLLFLFLGMVAGYLLWYLLSPNPNIVFSTQVETINQINVFTGNFLSNLQDVSIIFLKNLRLLVLTTALSVLFGVGAILIFSWNASVISVAIGQFIDGLGGPNIGSVSLGILRYLIHGIMEMASYFLGALAGAIVFIELLKWKWDKKHRKSLPHLAQDVGTLFFLGVVLLYAAAIVEVVVQVAF